MTDTETATDRSYYFEVHEHTYVHGVWRAELEGSDVLGWMVKDPDKPWHIGFRFRYYVDNKAFNSADRKSGYTITPRNPNAAIGTPEVEKLAAAFDTVFEAIAMAERTLGRRCSWKRYNVRDVGARAMDFVLAEPWAHRMDAGQMSVDKKVGHT